MYVRVLRRRVLRIVHRFKVIMMISLWLQLLDLLGRLYLLDMPTIKSFVRKCLRLSRWILRQRVLKFMPRYKVLNYHKFVPIVAKLVRVLHLLLVSRANQKHSESFKEGLVPVMLDILIMEWLYVKVSKLISLLACSHSCLTCSSATNCLSCSANTSRTL